MTTKLTEYNKAPEDQIVPRIIANVHAALDKNFPETQSIRPQFAKTVFAGGGESTAANHIQSDQKNFVNIEPLTEVVTPEYEGGQFSKEQKTIFVKTQPRTAVDYILIALFVVGIGILVYFLV